MSEIQPLEIISRNGKKYPKLNIQLKQYLALIPDDDLRLEVMTASLSEPLKWYCPNGKQEELINIIADRMTRARTPSVLFSAANGVGKTESALHIIANIVYGVQNGWFLHDVFLRWPNPQICWYITTKTGLTDVVVPAMKRLFPADTYRFDKMGTAVERAVHFENGWELRFFTMDVDPEQMESASVGLVVIDEPAPEPIWKAVKSRARSGMLTLLPMTPLDVEPYILDEVERQKDTALYARVTARIYDACERRGIRGHLEAGIVDEMVSKYPADERVARAEGDFMYFKEKIWSNLDPSIHFVEPEMYPVNFSKDFIIQVVDPHDSRPSACVYGAIQPNGRRVIFGETPIDHAEYYWEMRRSMRLDDEVVMWADYEDLLGISTVHRRVIDKRFGFQTHLNYNIARVYADAGRELDPDMHEDKRFVYSRSYDLRSTDKVSEIAYGHNLVLKGFDLMEDGEPGLVIWNTCVHACNGAIHYLRRRLNRASDSNLPAGESRIIEKYKDFNDLLRYFMAERVSQEKLEEKLDKKTYYNNTANRNVYSMISGQMRKARCDENSRVFRVP